MSRAPIKPACVACDNPAEKDGIYCPGHRWMGLPGANKLIEAFEETMVERDGSARHQLWTCEDNWLVGYTTEKTKGGPNSDKFEVLAYRPCGRGARSAKPREWRLVYRRGYVLRRKAKARALELFYKHSPLLAEKMGRVA